MTKTVISFTPLSLERDSRTLKMASSFARKGYRSIVLEFVSSQRTFESFGIEIISLHKKISDETVNLATTGFFKLYAMAIIKFVWRSMRYFGLGFLNDQFSYMQYKRDFHKKYSLQQAAIPKSNIYIFHSYEYVDFALNLSKNSTVIYDAHDFYQEINPKSDYSSLVRNYIVPYQKTMEKKLILRSNIFTTVSGGLCQKYKELFNAEPVVIRNAHDIRTDSNPKIGVRDFLKLKNDDIIICAVGNKKIGMAFDQVIEAFSLLPVNFHLVFIGNGYETFQPENSNIHCMPAQPIDEIVPFIKSADLGLIMYFDLTENYKYALPNGFFQLLSAKLPIVFPNQLYEVSLLHDKYSIGLSVDIKNVKDISQAIIKISNDIDFYKEALNNFNKNINWESEVNILLSLINLSDYKNKRLFNNKK